ncbi:MAG: redoxin domain-containing protein [Gemmataceae bacterium]|nr:redoxin domain-containing protein [Gemmataceae bacterium]
MRLSRSIAGLFSGGLAMLAGFQAAQSAPAPGQILSFKPKQEGIQITIPAAADEPSLKVELVKGAKKGSGWVLKDSQGTLLRRFFDTNDDNRIDIWSYYRDGLEVYRETDTNFNGKADQYRWLNSGGAKTGVDENEDERIDNWLAMSPEEASQEILRAVSTRDFSRLKSLLLTEADLKHLGLPSDIDRKVREQLSGAAVKFQATVAKTPGLSDKTAWLHVEMTTPLCLPTDQTGARADIYRYAKGTILYDTAGKTDWMQTGEMFLVNGAWKLADAPIPGAVSEEDGAPRVGGNRLDLEKDPELKKLVDELAALDATIDSTPGAGANPALAKHHLSRADLLEKILPRVKPEDRDPWVRQIADSLGSAMQNSPATDTKAGTRLASLEEQLAMALPGSNLAAYISFRKLQSDYSVRISKPGEDFAKLQADWSAQLTKFVQTYPKAEDTPDALLQLGMINEFLGKDVEARNWYGQVVKKFADKPQVAKASGSIRRLDSEGQLFTLSGKLLANPAQDFDIASLKDRVVVVYYWAGWNGQTVGDFAKLKLLQETYAPKGLELVLVNLDTTAEEANAFLKRSTVQGHHLHQPGGLDGKLATDYGIQVLPQIFLVGKDGKALGKNLQVSSLEDELKKHLK